MLTIRQLELLKLGFFKLPATRTQTVIQELIVELWQIHESVELHLPAPPAAISYQIRQLKRIQKRIQQFKQQIELAIGQKSLVALHYPYQTICQLTKQVEQQVLCLILIAEEYPSDPIGSISCLRQADIEHAQLGFTLEQLQIQNLTAKQKAA